MVICFGKNSEMCKTGRGREYLLYCAIRKY